MTIQEPIGWQEMPTIHTRTWTLQDVRAQVAVILTAETGQFASVNDLDVDLRGDIILGSAIIKRCEDMADAIMWECEDTFDIVLDPEKAAKITTASDLALAVWDDLRLQKRAG